MKKKLSAFILCAALALALAACGSAPADKPDDNVPAEDPSPITNENVQIPNPWRDFDTLADAEAAAGFDVTLPEAADRCADKSFRAMTGENAMLEIVCTDAEGGELRIRKAPGAEDASGDYNTYDQVSTVAVDELQVTMKGSGDQVVLAVWVSGDYTYAVSVSTGLSAADMSALVSAVQ